MCVTKTQKNMDIHSHRDVNDENPLYMGSQSCKDVHDETNKNMDSHSYRDVHDKNPLYMDSHSHRDVYDENQ